LVRDVAASAAYYRDKVGFTLGELFEDPPVFCILRRDAIHLMIARVDDPADIRPNWKVREGTWNVYFWVDDVESMYDELRRRGATIDYELCDQPYGCREFGIQDLDGHDIAFGQDLGAPAEVPDLPPT
jgi:catechol 2,3-dioxygenase-like lactoylglutathione lyase family enzyme